jgi:hypothetical protein
MVSHGEDLLSITCLAMFESQENLDTLILRYSQGESKNCQSRTRIHRQADDNAR